MEFLFLTFLFSVFSQGLSNVIPGKSPSYQFSMAWGLKNLSPFLAGPTVMLVLFTSFHSLGLNSRNAFIIMLVIAASIVVKFFYRLFQNDKNLDLLKSLRSNSSNLNDFFSAMALAVLFFVQTNSSILIDGYRTRGNNDPFDYLTLGRVFENSPSAFINFHEGWYQYSDRAGPWVTRLISLVQTILPGGRYGDFATFVFFNYFVLFLVSLKLLRNFHVQRSLALFLIYFIFTSSTMSYIFSQGFFLQVWGLIVILEFSRMLTLKGPGSLVLRGRLSLALLGIFIILTFFVYFPYVPLLMILYVCLNFKNLFQFRMFRVKALKETLHKIFNKQFIMSYFRVGFVVFLFWVYFVLVLFPPVRIMSSFFMEMSGGNYGWTRSADNYLGDGELGNQVPQSLLLSVFLILAIVAVLPKRNRTNINIGFLAFSIINVCVYTFYVLTNGLSSYQTWKYFSFLFPLTFLFSIISLNSLKISKAKRKDSRRLYNSRFILATLLLSFFVGKDLEGAPYPNTTQLNRQTISAIENIKNLQKQNVGLAFSDTGTNMLLGGIVPSKSIAMIGPSYYGKINEEEVLKLDKVLTSLNFLRSMSLCSSVGTVPVFDDLVLIDVSLQNRSCIDSMLH